MSILSRWKGRLRTRLRLRASARKRHDQATADLKSARRRGIHPRSGLVMAEKETAAVLKRRRAQVAFARTIIKRHALDADPAAKAISWGCKQVGTVEHPAGSNWGPKISDWIKLSGYSFGVPWCQCFANAVAVAGGAPQLRTGYTPTVLSGIGGYKRVALSKARKGDMVFFKFPGVSSASCDHVGVLISKTSTAVTCVEGNTSSGTGGSQNNGGGVFIRTRPISLVAGAVRPPYPKG